MKKILSLFTISVLVLFFSCELNEVPEFDESDAFVAFENTTMSVAEDAGSITIPITLASIAGIEGEVSYTVIDSTAKEGENYTIPDGSGTLTFDSENRTQYIEINIIDIPDVFTGDLRFKVELKEDGVVNPSAENTCIVTIQDLDHPLSMLLGEWTASGTSYFNAEESWLIEIEPDEDDVSVVWFFPFVAGGSGNPVYGVVDDELTEIRVPVGQEIAPPGDYGFIELRGYYGPDGAEEIPTGGYITITIEDDGSLHVQDEFGSYVWADEDQTDGLGWFNIFQADVVLTQ